MESTGWEHLLVKGGLLDQPEDLMDDVATISMLSPVIRKWVERGYR